MPWQHLSALPFKANFALGLAARTRGGDTHQLGRALRNLMYLNELQTALTQKPSSCVNCSLLSHASSCSYSLTLSFSYSFSSCLSASRFLPLRKKSISEVFERKKTTIVYNKPVMVKTDAFRATHTQAHGILQLKITIYKIRIMTGGRVIPQYVK